MAGGLAELTDGPIFCVDPIGKYPERALRQTDAGVL